MTVSDRKRSREWLPVRPDLARQLTDARLQLHYAAQFGTALGISYLPPRPDDSHTNLGWDETSGALVSQPVPVGVAPVAIGVRIADLTVLVLSNDRVKAQIPLHGLTIPRADARIRDALPGVGLDAAQYTLRRHYKLPQHPVATGGSFSTTNRSAFVELGHWYGNADGLLNDIRASRGGDEVRCWPHHFDIATMVTVAPGRTTGGGLSPGDGYYDEPYFYVNAHPQPRAESLVERLAGEGSWHTHEWIGAVLPTSRLTSDPSVQAAQARGFLASAFDACGTLVRG